ncbi:hypothetical protein [Mycolicibacterium madagascariense]|nr:hypothetical protein [Mycolicibacterium madagascariense]MCV7015317.1 hypothetical protein [Mycolicibacterium madagascariense]
MPQWSQDAVDALATAVSERRRYLGRSQLEVWHDGGPANSTMTSLEAAASQSVTRSTLTKLDIGLAWVPDTAAKVVRGEITATAAVRDPRFDARPKSDEEPVATDGAAAAIHDDVAALVAALAVDADDVRLSARAVDTDVDAAVPEQVQSFLSRVHDVLGDVDDLAGAVDEVARAVFGGDTERLRRMKRETKRLRRMRVASGNGTAAGIGHGPPGQDTLRAARTAPPGYQPGRPDQDDADAGTADGG